MPSGRLLRLDAVDVELGAYRAAKPAAAASAAAAAPATSAGRVCPAAVVLERAPPGDVGDGNLDCALAVDEVEGRERQRDAGIRFLGRERAGERRGHLLVIERRPLGLCRRLNQHELVAALDGLAVPEARRFLDPGRRLGDVRREPLVLVAQPHRALIVGDGALRQRREHRDERREYQTSDQGDTRTAHAKAPSEERKTRTLGCILAGRLPRGEFDSVMGASGESDPGLTPLHAGASKSDRLARSGTVLAWDREQRVSVFGLFPPVLRSFARRYGLCRKRAAAPVGRRLFVSLYMLHFRNGGLRPHARVTSDRARSARSERLAFGLSAAVAVAVLTGSFGAPTISAQSPAGETGWRARRLRHERASDVPSRRSRRSRLPPTSAAPRRRIVRRPAFPGTVRARGAQEMVTGAADDLNASEPVAFLQSFVGATLGETGALPPDPSGAAGPSQFILAANGKIRSFAKATATARPGAEPVRPTRSSRPVRAGANAFGPKIKYDRLAGRWFIIAATDAVPGRIVIASSNASTITAGTLWSFFAFDNTGFPGCRHLRRRLADVRARPVCALHRRRAVLRSRRRLHGHVRIRRPQDLGDRLCHHRGDAVSQPHGLVDRRRSLRPARRRRRRPDASRTGFFIGVDNASLGTLMLRRVSNPGGTPTISGNIAITVPATAAPITVRHLGNLGWTNGQIDGGDDRLTSATLVNGRLWTAHTIGVTHTGVASGSANRNGVRWYELGTVTTTPDRRAVRHALLEHRLRQLRPAQLLRAVDCDLDELGAPSSGTALRARASSSTAASSSGSRPTRPAPARAAALHDVAGGVQPAGGRRVAYARAGGGAESRRPLSTAAMARRSGRCSSSPTRPTRTALAVGRTVGLGAPTPVSVTPSVIASGVASINLQVTATSSGGTEFFDYGAGYLCRIGAAIPGVTVNSVTRTGPTTVTINVSTVGATPGLKTISVINPDAQGATSGADPARDAWAARGHRLAGGGIRRSAADGPRVGGRWHGGRPALASTPCTSMRRPRAARRRFSARRPTGSRVPMSAARTVRASRPPASR